MIGKNNPFNIRIGRNKWLGLIGFTRGFCDFDTLEHGVRVAAYLIIKSYPKKGFKTIAELITRFAPPSENNTGRYICFVCNKDTCLLPFDVPQDKTDYVNILHYMSIFEGNKVSKEFISCVLDKYFKL